MEDMKNRRIICISGFTASGKSTVARRLSKTLGIPFISGGNALKKIKLGNNKKEGWWVRDAGQEFLRERRKCLDIDKMIDDELIKIATKEKEGIFDSWTLPWLIQEGIKIWLDASLPTRGRRAAMRDHISYEESLSALKEKDSISRDIYYNLYGIDFGRDFSPFDVVLKTDKLSDEGVYKIVRCVVDELGMYEGES
jgi:cytidylate kinase